MPAIRPRDIPALTAKSIVLGGGALAVNQTIQKQIRVSNLKPETKRFAALGTIVSTRGGAAFIARPWFMPRLSPTSARQRARLESAGLVVGAAIGAAVVKGRERKFANKSKAPLPIEQRLPLIVERAFYRTGKPPSMEQAAAESLAIGAIVGVGVHLTIGRSGKFGKRIGLYVGFHVAEGVVHAYDHLTPPVSLGPLVSRRSPGSTVPSRSR